jgi:phenylalanyl-tRNA synthetase beta subunit
MQLKLGVPLCRYCKSPFQVEPVQVTDSLGDVHVFPNLESRSLNVTSEYINKYIGIDLSADKMAEMLTKMQLASTVADDGALPHTASALPGGFPL